MADERSKVIVISDEKGALHITPANNETFYKNRNQITRKQLYVVKERFDNVDDAVKYVEKNKGKDPGYIPAEEVKTQLTAKDNQISALEAELAKLKAASGIAKASNKPDAKEDAKEPEAKK